MEIERQDCQHATAQQTSQKSFEHCHHFTSFHCSGVTLSEESCDQSKSHHATLAAQIGHFSFLSTCCEEIVVSVTLCKLHNAGVASFAQRSGLARFAQLEPPSTS